MLCIVPNYVHVHALCSAYILASVQSYASGALKYKVFYVVHDQRQFRQFFPKGNIMQSLCIML